MLKNFPIRLFFNKLLFFIKLPAKIALRPFFFFKFLKNDLLSLLGTDLGGTNILFVAGFPKSGTTWVDNFFTNIRGYNQRQLSGDPEIIRHHNLPDDAFKWLPQTRYSSIKTHINPNERNLSILKKGNIKKILVMYRDPRDIAVSNYYHVLKHNPWKKTDKFYLNYKNVSKLDGLSHSLNMVIKAFPPWINGWFDLAKTTKSIDFYFLSYEELRNNEEDNFLKLIQFFEINISRLDVQNILKKISKRKKKFDPKRRNLYGYNSTFRQGKIGDWELELDDNLKLIANKKLSQILMKLGYNLSAVK